MDNKQEASNSQEMNEARKPKKSLKERCKEMGAIPHSKFAHDWMQQLEQRFKK